MSFLTTLMKLDAVRDMPALQCADLLRELESQFKAGPDHPEKPMRIQGQDGLVHRLMMGVVMNEHILLEGLPGVAKTTAVELLSRDTGLSCRRIQFVPDMQPSDLIGKDQIHLAALSAGASKPDEKMRYWENGPLFQNIVIADEINRAPAKVQAALLESMAERAITPFGKTKYVIRSRREWQMWARWIFSVPAYRTRDVWGSEFWPDLQGQGSLSHAALNAVVQAMTEQEWDQFGPAFPWVDRSAGGEKTFGATPIDLRNPQDAQFTVFATMNPIEQEGTYPLSEAQTDRFCFKTIVRYPSYGALQAITQMINPPCRHKDPDEDVLKNLDSADEAMRRSLYFFRRCREAMFGPPGQQENSLLEKGFLGKVASGGSREAMDLVTRIVFYSHMRQPEAGSRRGQQLAQILKDAEQIERQARLLREDQALAAMARHDVWQYIKSGASPRAQLFLAKAAVCEYLLDGCPGAHISLDHVRRIVHDVLRHRIRLNVQAHVRGIHAEDVVDILLQYITDSGKKSETVAIIHTIAQDILSRVNGEIYESASLVSEDLLTGLFRALFRVERATEFSEPDIFGASDDPALLMDKRMSAAHWKYLPIFISNDEILAKRFQLFTEYDFVFVADLTPSMTYRWRDLYVGQTGMSENADFLPADATFAGSDYSSTKMYILKYLLYAFLLSAVRFGFRSRVVFFTMDDSITMTGNGEEFPFQAVDFVDRYLMDADNVNAWESADHHTSPCERVLQELMETRTESVLVFATDFMDVVHGRFTEEQMDPYLAELRYRHRLSVLQINDPREVNTLDNRDDRPSSTRWAFQRDVEVPDEGGIGKQRFYRAAARNREFMEKCRRVLGSDDLLNGSIAERLTGRGITMQKFVYGHGFGVGNRIEQRLQEIGSWLEEN